MKIISLMYHCVYKDDILESGFINNTALAYKLRASVFENQVALIADYCIKNRKPMASVTFTFDDGGISFYNIIAPILEKYGFKGTFFIPTAYIGTKGFLNKEQIVELYHRGHIIGSHSHTHPENLSELSPKQIDYEWQKSIDLLSTIIGNIVTVASIPNGFESKNIIESAKRYGITRLYTSNPTTSYKEVEGVTIIGRYALQSNFSNQYVLSILHSKSTRLRIQMRWIILQIAKEILGKKYIEIHKILFNKFRI
ncbi:MAG: polysaccharide deacetylase family protein [Bacteroidales bacterium]|nr:polysaccharide deacetylase family protein [Bacteroidales bacterium]